MATLKVEHIGTLVRKVISQILNEVEVSREHPDRPMSRAEWEHYQKEKEDAAAFNARYADQQEEPAPESEEPPPRRRRPRPSEREAERRAVQAASDYFNAPPPDDSEPEDEPAEEKPWIPYSRLNLEEENENE